MRAPDIAAVVLAVVALALTGVGIAKSDDWTGEHTYRYTASAGTPLPAQPDTPASATPARFEIPVPDGGVGLQSEVKVSYQSNGLQGGNAVIRIGGTAPDGSPLPVQTRTLAVGPTGTTGAEAAPYTATWLDTPRTVRDTHAPTPAHWDRPLVLLVTVEPPQDLPGASYTFTASVGGAFVTAIAA